MLMQFEDALSGLKFGHKLRRKSWPEGNYICVKDGVLESHVEGHGDRPISTIDSKELFAHDWEII